MAGFDTHARASAHMLRAAQRHGAKQGLALNVVQNVFDELLRQIDSLGPQPEAFDADTGKWQQRHEPTFVLPNEP
jgi:hypothetical protein